MIEFDPFSQDVISGDKYGLYRRLRDEAPASFNSQWGCWAISRFEDIWDLCAGDALSSAKGTTTAHLLTKVQPVTPMLNSMDPPEHSRLRGRIRTFFMPRRVRELEPFIRDTTTELLDHLRDRQEIDFVTDFAQPLATAVGCRVIGLPAEDATYLRDVVSRFFDRDPQRPGMSDTGLQAMEDMYAYLAEFTKTRRAHPSELHDPIDELIAWRDEHNQPLDDADIASHLSLLLNGGTDTLPKVLANLLVRLQQNPDQRRALAQNPQLAVPAFNEAVRTDMPTQMMARTLVRDVPLHGQTMREGQPLLLLYASGNRDEREFADPDRFDIDRRPTRTLSFSHGSHACIGLHIARKEGEVAINEVLRRFPNYMVDEQRLERYSTEFVQGYSSVPMRLGGH
jgi:cytochrome P450